MSVASKTKTKVFATVFLASMVVILGGPIWADMITMPVADVSSQSNQDLSVLRSKLKERFSWITQEARVLIAWTPSATETSQKGVIRTLDLTQWIGSTPAISHQDYFVDIENDPYKTYINRLAAYGVLSSSSKFYPQNYFRTDDFIALLAKLYKKNTGKLDLSQDILWLSSVGGVMTKWMLQNVISLLEDVERIHIDGNPYDKLIRSEAAYYLARMFDVPVLALDEESFEPLTDVFVDIANHPFAFEINILASLGVVNTQANKFYPDNYLRHYDFVVLFSNTLLAYKGHSLSRVSFTSQFSDVEAWASYLPQLAYAQERGLIDPLVDIKNGQLYFDPNAFMTKYEVYRMLAKVTSIHFVYDEKEARTEKISRAELAKLLVEGFQLVPKKTSDSQISTWTVADQISLISKVKTLLSML